MADKAGAILTRAGYRMPTPLQQKLIPLILTGRDVLVEAPPGSGKTVALLCPLALTLKASRPAILAVILVQDAEETRKAQRQWRTLTRAGGSTAMSAAIGADAALRKETPLLTQRPHVLFATPQRLIDHIRQGNVDLAALRLLAVDAPALSPDFDRDVEFITSKCPPERQTVIFVPAMDESSAERFGGGRQRVVLRASEWQNERREQVPNEGADTRGEVDEESLKATIKTYLERITQVENPEEMNALKRIYRRSVPLHLRTYLAAYLLRELRGGGATPARTPPKAFSKTPAKAAARGGGKSAGPSKAASGKHARLFINVGRNRRVYPNDIYDLFTSQLGIDRSEIGEVRVLDNYSFVEIHAKHAERAIAELTGKELRGRALTVNFARPREDKQRE